MSHPERGSQGNMIDEIERLLKIKEPRLPKGLAKHIRNLKAEGRIDLAQARAKQYRTRRKHAKLAENAKDMLSDTVLDLLNIPNGDTKDSNVVEKAVNIIKISWLLNATGYIENDERIIFVRNLYMQPCVQDHEEAIAARWEEVHEEIKHFMPKSS